jgi:hypothetical protein
VYIIQVNTEEISVLVILEMCAQEDYCYGLGRGKVWETCSRLLPLMLPMSPTNLHSTTTTYNLLTEMNPIIKVKSATLKV